MIHNQNIHNRLYLSQGDETIYIDNCKLPQHHIEGIRFLYRQFKRRMNGVIINDPYSFGRNIQIILFLKAIRRLLHKPILILCQEGSEHDWYDRFYTWTDMIDEVAIETANPMIKKMVVINTMVNLHLFCSREWSIVVVDGDEVTSPNPILKLPFKSSFKIWNTSVNMKENLDRFEEIYKWLFPSEIFDKNYFIADHESAVDVIEKSILLDSFFEDIVLRRDDLNSSFEDYQRNCNVVMPTPPIQLHNTTITLIAPPTSTATSATTTATVAPATATLTPATATVAPATATVSPATATISPATTPVPPAVTISKKNKDATGTKIKRSKTRIDTETFNKPFQPPVAVLSKLLGETSKDYNSTEDFSIENYERKNSKDNEQNQSSTEENKDDIKKDKEFEIIEIDNPSSKSDIQLFYEPDSESKSAVDKLVEMDTLVFGHDTFISKVSDMIETGKEDNTVADKKETEPHTILTCKPVGDQSTHNKLFTENKKGSNTVTSTKVYEASKSSDYTERDKKNDSKSLLSNKSKVSTDKPEIDITKTNLDELNKEMRYLDTGDNSEELAKRLKITDIKNQSVTYDEIKVKSNELNEQTSDSGTKDTQVANSLKRNNIDEKMKECEEKVSKKFKGSFLDSLF